MCALPSQFIEHVIHSTSNYTPYTLQWIPVSAKLVVCGCTARGTGQIEILELADSKLKSQQTIAYSEGIKCSTFAASHYETRILSSGDYAGNILCWDIDRLAATPCIKIAKAHESIINSIDGVAGLNIGFGAPEIVTGSRDGDVKIWDLRQTSEPVCEITTEVGAQSRDCWVVAFGNSYNESERCVVSGYDNGDIKLLDLNANAITWSTNVKNGVVGLHFDRKDIAMNKLLVTTLESSYRVYDMRTKNKTKGYSCSIHTAHKSTIWLARHTPSSRDLWLTTGGNGSMSLWKYSYPAQRQIKDPENEGDFIGVMGDVILQGEGKWGEQPIVSAEWHPDKVGLLATASLDHQIRIGIVTKLQT